MTRKGSEVRVLYGPPERSTQGRAGTPEAAGNGASRRPPAAPQRRPADRRGAGEEEAAGESARERSYAAGPKPGAVWPRVAASGLVTRGGTPSAPAPSGANVGDVVGYVYGPAAAGYGTTCTKRPATSWATMPERPHTGHGIEPRAARGCAARICSWPQIHRVIAPAVRRAVPLANEDRPVLTKL